MGQLIALCLKEKKELNYEGFKKLTEQVCSDMFLSVYLFLRRSMPLYDQVYLYADRIKKAPRGTTPRNLHVISSPKMLSTLSPVSKLMKRAGSCKKLSINRGKTSPEKSSPKVKQKSTFNQKSTFESEVEKLNKEEEFSSATCCDESLGACETLIHKVPLLKVNTNDLRWQKEQNSSKDNSFFQDNYGVGVRQPNKKKLSTFSSENEFTNEEEKKVFSKFKPQNPEPTSLVYCECGELIERDNFRCSHCVEKKKPIDFSGPLLFQEDNSIHSCWLRLLNKELYCIKYVIIK